MKSSPIIGLRLALLAGCASVALAPAVAAAQSSQPFVSFDIPAQDLDSALTRFGQQSEREIIISSALTRNRRAPAVQGNLTPEDALGLLLAESGLTYRVSSAGSLVVEAADPQGGSAAAGGAEVEALIVTAQKREEDIQDVPIAMSAFTQEDLERSQIAGGPDLITQVPNMTFTKTNFSAYSIQIRGIGTQAISATTDAAVAVAFNNTPFIHNRFFEQEFYDLQRVEVLRGPQGTLYGRNATAGVVNLISQKPRFNFEAKLSGDVANYNSTRLEGMFNVPIVEDVVALRLAGAWTKRDGFVTNDVTGNPIDGRDLWSTRLSLRFAPTDRIEANLIWEHFEEDDDRLRSGKQLCKTHEITEVSGEFPDGTPFNLPTTHFQIMPETGQPSLFSGVQGTFSQGCSAASLYSPDSFQVPSGLALPYYGPFTIVGGFVALDDPYLSRTQSRDLRVIESTVDPQYKSESDLVELQLSFDISDSLTLTSETAYSVDSVFSTQDYNRFATAPGAWTDDIDNPAAYRAGILNDGVFCDPQIGCTDRFTAVDLSTAESRQFSQEFRLSSDFDGPLNFGLGANFLRFDTVNKYYVFLNSISMVSAQSFQQGGRLLLPAYEAGISDNIECFAPTGLRYPDPLAVERIFGCTYIDPNPIGSLNDMGHNYFLSKNPYKLISYAVFGEVYYNLTENLKITAGLRWTVDKKEAPLIPSWLLASGSIGYPVAEVIEQEWREPTGRLAIDWKPDLAFTDETLIYASYAHGYKAGGANPPLYGKALWGTAAGAGEVELEESASHPKTFEPEFIDAFELGSKNTLLDGRLTMNVAAFYYDYEGYQISQIVDRSASNLNFDAEVWGLEIEVDWRPLENFRLGFKGGYENTRVADGETAIDLMDRTAGMPGWMVVSPQPSIPSNCILPTWLYVGTGDNLNGNTPASPEVIQVGSTGGGGISGCEYAYSFNLDPVTQRPYVANPTVAAHPALLQSRPGYPGWDPSTAPNNGEGFSKDLSGNELPNAPDFTATITADYTIPLPNEWLATLHTDLYYQSEAWTRIFNMEGYDKLKAYSNINLAAIFTNEDAGWKVMAYVKNVLDRDSITGAFLNSDDSGLTTNVFLTEPRLYGLRVTKTWSGGSLLGSFGGRGEGLYPFTVELGGQVQRHDASVDPLSPSFIDSFSSTLDPRRDQDINLDWGDGREVKVTYDGGVGWKASLGARFGKTNGAGRGPMRSEAGDGGCVGIPKYYPPDHCATRPGDYRTSTNWSQTDGSQREDHTIIDFSVKRDVGFGMFGDGARSELGVSVRYAQLTSERDLSLYGVPDWNVPDGKYTTPLEPVHLYRFSGIVSREFEGAGPMLSWDAAQQLFGSDEVGHVHLDWSLSGGVLFGEREVSMAGEEKTNTIGGTFFGPTLVDTEVEPVGFERSDSVSVPTIGASLGLSYTIDRMKVGAGYRWERYIDAIDGGDNTEVRDADRTIDGPYFKLSVGFGGG